MPGLGGSLGIVFFCCKVPVWGTGDELPGVLIRAHNNNTWQPCHASFCLCSPGWSSGGSISKPPGRGKSFLRQAGVITPFPGHRSAAALLQFPHCHRHEEAESESHYPDYHGRWGQPRPPAGGLLIHTGQHERSLLIATATIHLRTVFQQGT